MCRLVEPELHHYLVVLGMDDHRVAEPAEAQKLLAPLASLLPIRHLVQGENRRELLVRKRVLRPDPIERTDQNPRAFGNRDPGGFGDRGSGPAHHLRVHHHGAQIDQYRGEALALVRLQDVSALLLDRRQNLFANGAIVGNRLFRGAQRTVVEGGAGEDIAHRLLHVGGTLDVGRDVAGADSVGRLAGGIRRLHHGAAAGGQDHVGVIAAHQLLGSFHADHRHAADDAAGGSGRHRRLVQDIGRRLDTGLGRRVGREHDAAACLERDQALEQCGRGGVGGGDDGGDDSHRLGDLEDALLAVLAQDPDGGHAAHGLDHIAQNEIVLGDLVGLLAEAGLLARHGGETLRLAQSCRRHRLDDGVDLLLRELLDLPLRRYGGARQSAGLVDRAQVTIEIGRAAHADRRLAWRRRAIRWPAPVGSSRPPRADAESRARKSAPQPGAPRRHRRR